MHIDVRARLVPQKLWPAVVLDSSVAMCEEYRHGRQKTTIVSNIFIRTYRWCHWKSTDALENKRMVTAMAILIDNRKFMFRGRGYRLTGQHVH